MTKRLHVNRAEGANNPWQAWSRSPSPLTSEAQSLTFHPHSPSSSRCPLHPITMKRPIRQISKDGRLRVITHDVSRQIKKRSPRKKQQQHLSSNIHVLDRLSTQSPRHSRQTASGLDREDYRRHGRKSKKKGRDLNQSLRWPGNSPTEKRSVLR